ncbi:MAG: aminoacyl-histidine dipeptidase [Acutalibacteraceae bacterium]|nr:aminoacyl-histidine dipeptidase [Acutalibacteraceae bacterium]
MKNISKETESVFRYFEKICAIPHGSGNMEAIGAYCLEFARKNNLQAAIDEAGNVIVYKPGTKGYENAEPIILQGHLDMVCQKREETVFDFEKDGIKSYINGDFIKAKGTTLGADNGIAVAMIMSVLASQNLSHPPIEAVFTTDEEIGMVGAKQIDFTRLKSKRMINLDSEESDILTVSCAGGSDFELLIPTEKMTVHGTEITLEIGGLKGGHSGVDIDKCRVNADILAGRILNYAKKNANFNIIKINGGTKGNAIPFCCKAQLVAKDAESFINITEEYISALKNEIADREEDCFIRLTAGSTGDFEVLSPKTRDKLLYLLLTTPNGVVDMSAEIDGLVETSLNLGILMTEDSKIIMQYALRSNKSSALTFLEDKMTELAEYNGCRSQISCRYEPWEYKKESELRKLYSTAFCEKFGHEIKISAIHAGLECAVFAQNIEGLDCISVGPDMFDVHTVNERLSISSATEIFELLCDMLERCK